MAAHDTALIAMHYQNDVVNPDGRIKVGMAEGDPARAAVLQAAGELFAGARRHDLPIYHVRIAFKPDYSDLIANCPIMRRTQEAGAVKDGTWGAEFFDALRPLDTPRETVFTHKRISAFVGTPLLEMLHWRGVRRLVVSGVATHSSVENTVREAVDRGYVVSVASTACHAAGANTHQASLDAMSLIAHIHDVPQALAWALGSED